MIAGWAAQTVLGTFNTYFLLNWLEIVGFALFASCESTISAILAVRNALDASVCTCLELFDSTSWVIGLLPDCITNTGIGVFTVDLRVV